MAAILSETVDINDDVYGLLWSVSDLEKLSHLIAVIALGQAQHAVRIIQDLEPHGPALSHSALYAGAKEQMQISGETDKQRKVSRYHRDGFLFECISWIIARQDANDRTYFKDPHISATTQGLDGLSIAMHPTNPEIVQATIFEDKCTKNPREQFKNHVMPAFIAHHNNQRSRDLIANAVSLIRESGLNSTDATHAAARVLDRKYRAYRAALTVGSTKTTSKKRQQLFKGYDDLEGLKKHQRIGATLVVHGDLRTWFQILADQVTSTLEKYEVENV